MYSTSNSNYPQLKWVSVTSYTVNGPIGRLQAATCYPRSCGTLQRVTHVSLEGCSPPTLHSNWVIWFSLESGNLLQSEHNNGDRETFLFQEYRRFFPRGKSAGAWSSPLISIQCLRQERVALYLYSRYTCFCDVDRQPCLRRFFLWHVTLCRWASSCRRSEKRCACIFSPKLSERSVQPWRCRHYLLSKRLEPLTQRCRLIYQGNRSFGSTCVMNSEEQLYLYLTNGQTDRQTDRQTVRGK